MTTALVDPRDGTGRLFIVKRPGQILILEAATSCLSVSRSLEQVSCCESERGMASLAFHPDYETNGRFFVGYVNNNIETVVSRFTVSADPSRADPASERELLSWERSAPIITVAFWPSAPTAISTSPTVKETSGSRRRISGRSRARSYGSTLTAARPTRFRRTTRSATCPGCYPRSGPGACATPGGSASIARPGIFLSATSAERATRRSTSAPASSEGGLNYGWPIKEAEGMSQE